MLLLRVISATCVTGIRAELLFCILPEQHNIRKPASFVIGRTSSKHQFSGTVVAYLGSLV